MNTNNDQNQRDKSHTQSLSKFSLVEIENSRQYNSAKRETSQINLTNPQIVSPFLLGKGSGDRSRIPSNNHSVLTSIKRDRNQRRILTRFLSCVFLFTFLFLSNIHAQTFSTPKTLDFEDFIAFVQSFGSKKGDQNYNLIADLNDDGTVNFPDFLGFASSFGKTFLEPDPPIIITPQIAYNAQTNTSRITLSFSQQIRLVTEKSLSFTTPSINLETGISEKKGLNIQNVELDTNRQILTLSISSAIADSSLLSLTRNIDPQADTTDNVFYLNQFYPSVFGIWVYNAYQPITGEITLSSSFSPAQATLSLRPFVPTDINLFTPGVYTDAAPMTPASTDTLTEITARTALETFLAKRITNTDILQQTLTKFDDPNLIAKMPNPTLRAGLISLTGTLGESGIDAILRGPFGPLTFGPVTTGDYAEIQNDRSVIIDERYASEAFPLFGPIFTRMALQLDQQTGRAEETTTSAFLALVAMQQTLTDSTFAQSGSELSRRLNTQMLARLNSGQANFPNIGIYQTPNGQAFPNGAPFTSYAAVFTPLANTPTPAGNLLATYLKTLSSPDTELPVATSFNNDILTFIDQHQNVLSSEDLIRIARILKLQVAEP